MPSEIKKCRAKLKQISLGTKIINKQYLHTKICIDLHCTVCCYWRGRCLLRFPVRPHCLQNEYILAVHGSIKVINRAQLNILTDFRLS